MAKFSVRAGSLGVNFVRKNFIIETRMETTAKRITRRRAMGFIERG